jgi:hypothetical protein
LPSFGSAGEPPDAQTLPLAWGEVRVFRIRLVHHWSRWVPARRIHYLVLDLHLQIWKHDWRLLLTRFSTFFFRRFYRCFHSLCRLETLILFFSKWNIQKVWVLVDWDRGNLFRGFCLKVLINWDRRYLFWSLCLYLLKLYFWLLCPHCFASICWKNTLCYVKRVFLDKNLVLILLWWQIRLWC